MNKKKKGSLSPYGYLLPCMLIFAVFLFYPFFKTIYLSFYKTDKMGQAKLFVGIENYKELLTSPSFLNSLKVTLIFVGIVVVGSMIIDIPIFSKQFKSNLNICRNCCCGKYDFRADYRSAV